MVYEGKTNAVAVRTPHVVALDLGYLFCRSAAVTFVFAFLGLPVTLVFLRHGSLL
jgi:hypothetical protein